MKSMLNDQSSSAYAILILKNKIYIENKRQNKMFSITKDTYIIHQENPNLTKIKTMDKIIETQGILGIIELNTNTYYLIYITQSNIIALINGSQINQITQIAFLPLSTIQPNEIDQHKQTLNSFQQMISKGMYYYSLTYDLTNLIQHQRGYIEYKIAKTDYLWNNNFITYFNNNNIAIESFFVFCICGYIKACSSSFMGKQLVHIFIARKNRFNFKANHTQVESIIAYDDQLIFNYTMFSFGYSNDVIQGESICLENFKKYYSHYNKSKQKRTNMIVNILDDENKDPMAVEPFINQIIFKTFDKAKFFQFRCEKEFTKEIQSFILGILTVIHECEYDLINKTLDDAEGEGGMNEDCGEDNVLVTQEFRIQKGCFIIISNDGNFSSIEFERCLLWEVIELFFSKFKPIEEEVEDNTLIKVNNEIKRFLYGGNDDNNSHKSNGSSRSNSMYNKKQDIKVSFKDKYESMFDDYLKQTVSIDQFNDYTAMNYFLIEQQIKPIVKFYHNYKLLSNSSSTNTSSKEQNLIVYISTWNIGALSTSNNQDISPLLHPMNYCSYLNKNPVDFYLIGLQEIVQLNPHLVLFASNETAVNHWVKAISKEIPNHKLVTSMSLVGILFLFFAKQKIVNDIKDFQSQIIKTGFFGTLGNKGSCSIRFTYHKKNFAFSSGHFASGKGSNEERLNELNNIASTIYDKDRRFTDSDYWFIFGDMNFRSELNTSNALMYIESLCLESLKSNDQLIKSKKRLEFEYEEEDIRFYPSYKFFSKTDEYNKKQTPSWCDRILYKPSKSIKSIAYDKIEILCSDHMPVIGIFQLTIPE